MLRVLVWSFLYCLLLGTISIDVRYKDGLHMRFKGWLDMIKEGWKKRK